MSHVTWGPFGATPLDYRSTPEEELRAQGQDPHVPANWSIPETQWVTWGGEVALPVLALFDPNQPFVEVARIELPTPRAIFATFCATGPPGGDIEFRVHQGIGRAELVRGFNLASQVFGNAIDPIFPCRIARVLCRESINSAFGAQLVVQVVMAPIYPDQNMRKAGVLR